MRKVCTMARAQSACTVLTLCASLLVATVVATQSHGDGNAQSPAHSISLRHGLVQLEKLSLSGNGGPGHQRRSLLLDKQQSRTKHIHHEHQAWSVLGSHATYLFSFAGTSYTAQQRILSELETQGAAVSSVLPPHTWVVIASPSTAHWLAQIPDTVLASYPSFLKLAPEWVQVLEDADLPDLARQVQRAMQHDSLIACGHEPEPEKEQEHDAWLECRAAVAAAQQPSQTSQTQAAEEATQQADAAESAKSDRKKRRLPKARWHEDPSVPQRVQASGSKATQQDRDTDKSDTQSRKKLLIDVIFPLLSKADLERLGLSRVPAWADPMQNTLHAAATPRRALMQARQQAMYANGTYVPQVAAALDWHAPLQRVARVCGADLLTEHGSLMVAVCPKDLMSVLTWLADQPTVRWLAPRVESHTLNLGAASISQSGGAMAGGITDTSSGALRPFWAAGIDGTGQVVGCGDSGIDLDNCYFFDQTNLINRNSFSNGRNGVLVYDNPQHRKVVAYYALYGNVVDQGGHGSHVSGTLVGSAWGTDPKVSPARATGQAPGAKIAFMSLSAPTDRTGATFVRTPGDLSQSYYPLTYAKGARIHSDSWGSNNTGYDNSCATADMFAYENQDFLPVFAAGNYGDEIGVTSTTPTITSPGLAKNVMTVGATLNYDSLASPGSAAPALTITISINTNAQPMVVTALMTTASIGGAWNGLLNTPLQIAGAYGTSGSADACGQLSNTAAIAGKVVIAVRSRNCDTGIKLNNVANAGGRALIVTNNLLEGYFTITGGGGVDTSGLPPVGSVPLGIGRFLWDAANSPLGATVTFSARPSQGSRYDVLAAFSSFGPTAMDNRIKPDLVAPGVLISAWTDFALTGSTQCSSTTKGLQGTSMSTPAAAGNAALVKHYFAAGFYPTGSPAATNPKFQASGPLVRAVLMAGAAAMQGVVELSNPNAGGLPMERPSVRQGWGRVDLSGSLPLAGNTYDKGWSLQVVDQAKIAQGGNHRYCVSSTGGPLRIMLVYHDYPADMAANAALVNNLDLQVKAEGLGNKLLLGNVYANNYMNPENKTQLGDNVNNVESVFLDNVPLGLVVINVLGVSVSAKGGPQPYALAVVGKFSGTLASAANPAYNSSIPNLCPDINALVDPVLSPPPPNQLSSSPSQTFYLTTTTGQALDPGQSFQCQLLNRTGATAPPPLHDWRTCTSPVTYTNLPDGTYTFRVRISGSNFPDARTWRIDSTPPVTSLISTLPATVTAANGQTSAAQNATFDITVRDASTVNITCFLILTNPVAGGPALTAPYMKTVSPNAPPLPVCNSTSCPGTPCNPPVSLWGLSYGDWAMRAQATDQAGNVDQSGATVAWRIRYSPSVTYTRITASPDTPRRLADVPLSLFAFTGTASTGLAAPLSTTTTAYEYVVYNASSPVPTAWTAAPSATFNVTLPADGTWIIQARVANDPAPGPDSNAVALVQLDTTAPVVVITDQPNPIIGLKDGGTFLATVKYTTTVQDETVVFQCRWVNSSTAAVPLTSPEGTGLAAFSTANCAGPQAGTSSLSVGGGYWLFQVRATDAVGNLGQPASAQFLVDVQAPVISNVVYPPYTRDRAVNISYAISDAGLAGLATNNITCTMTALYLVPTASPLLGPLPGSPYQAVSGIPQAPCPNPASYALAEGRYQWQLTVPDNAGLTSTVTLQVVLDLQPPVARVTNSVTSLPFPKNVQIQFQAVDQPTAGGSSGVNQTICTLVYLSQSITNTISPPPPGPAAPPPPPAPPSPGGSSPSPPAANRSSPAPSGGRRLSSDNSGCYVPSPSPSPAPSARRSFASTTPGSVVGTTVNGANVLNNVSFPCTSPVALQGLSTGTYQFQVYAIDNSGNSGNPDNIGRYSFLVDDSLPINSPPGAPGGGSGGGGWTNNRWAIIATIVASAVLVGIIVGIVVHVRQRRARKRAAMLAQQQNGMGPPNYGTMWYGYPAPAVAQDPYAQQRQYEEERMRQAIQASMEEENMRKAMEMSRREQLSKIDDERIQRAIQASLSQR